MKKFRFLSLLWVILLAWTLAGCGGDKGDGDFIIEDITWQNDAVIDYNDTLVDLASKCIESENNIWNAYNGSNSEDIINAINDTIAECSNAWKKVNELWNWEWDSTLKDWVIKVTEKEIAYYSKFSELLPYLGKEEPTDEEKEIYNSIFSEVESLDAELKQANTDLTTIQENFAHNHGFELEDEDEGIEVNE